MFTIQQYPTFVELKRETASGEFIIQFYTLETFSVFIRVSPIKVKGMIIEQMLPAIISFDELSQAKEMVRKYFA